MGCDMRGGKNNKICRVHVDPYCAFGCLLRVIET